MPLSWLMRDGKASSVALLNFGCLKLWRLGSHLVQVPTGTSWLDWKAPAGQDTPASVGWLKSANSEGQKSAPNRLGHPSQTGWSHSWRRWRSPDSREQSTTVSASWRGPRRLRFHWVMMWLGGLSCLGSNQSSSPVSQRDCPCWGLLLATWCHIDVSLTSLAPSKSWRTRLLSQEGLHPQRAPTWFLRQEIREKTLGLSKGAWSSMVAAVALLRLSLPPSGGRFPLCWGCCPSSCSLLPPSRFRHSRSWNLSNWWGSRRRPGVYFHLGLARAAQAGAVNQVQNCWLPDLAWAGAAGEEQEHCCDAGGPSQAAAVDLPVTSSAVAAERWPADGHTSALVWIAIGRALVTHLVIAGVTTFIFWGLNVF